MSFAPPSPGSPPPPSPAGGPSGPPRSTPIPGFESPIADAAPPQAPTAFINSSTTPTSGFPGLSDMSPPPPVTTSRSFGGVILALVVLLGVGAGVYTFMRARDTADKADQAIDDAHQTVDSLLQGVQDDIDSIPVPGGVPATVPGVTVSPAPPAQVSLFADGGAASVVASFEATISGEPSRFMQVLLYPDYAFASAQDANALTHVDEYPWREGVVGASSPVQLFGEGDLEATLWNASDVDWTFIPRAVAEAPGLTTVEQGAVSHIIVDRSVFTDDLAIVVRVYVTGPRGSAYVEYTPAGVLIDVVQ